MSRAGSTDDWRAHHEQYAWLVATGDDDQVVGFAKASPWKGRCAYTYSAEVTVYVKPDHHGRGIASALYAELLPRLETSGFHTLFAGITVPNDASERLHARFGFERLGVLREAGRKFDGWHDVALWQRQLRDASHRP